MWVHTVVCTLVHDAVVQRVYGGHQLADVTFNATDSDRFLRLRWLWLPAESTTLVDIRPQTHIFI